MKKVLVLEDEANIRSFVVINLKRAGYETIEAETGEQALEQLKKHPDKLLQILNSFEVSKEAYLEILYSNPCGFKLTAAMTTNYRQLKTIYYQRKK